MFIGRICLVVDDIRRAISLCLAALPRDVLVGSRWTQGRLSYQQMPVVGKTRPREAPCWGILDLPWPLHTAPARDLETHLRTEMADLGLTCEVWKKKEWRIMFFVQLGRRALAIGPCWVN